MLVAETLSDPVDVAVLVACEFASVVVAVLAPPDVRRIVLPPDPSQYRAVSSPEATSAGTTPLQKLL